MYESGWAWPIIDQGNGAAYDRSLRMRQIMNQSGVGAMLCVSALAVAFGGANIKASVIPLSAGDQAVFTDDFDNNSAGWTLQTGQFGTIGSTDGTGATVWQPTTIGDGNTTAIQLTLPTALNIADGPISIYYRVRAGNKNDQNNCRFVASMYGTNGNNGYFGFQLAPSSSGVNTFYLARNSPTLSSGVGTVYVPPDAIVPSSFINYKLTLAANGDGTYSMSEYKDVTNTGNYAVWGGAANDVVPIVLGASAVIGVGGTARLPSVPPPSPITTSLGTSSSMFSTSTGPDLPRARPPQRSKAVRCNSSTMDSLALRSI